MVIVALAVTACAVLQIIGMWKALKKAGLKGWEAIIPFYNTYQLVRISGLELWWFVIYLVIGALSVVGAGYYDINTGFQPSRGTFAIVAVTLVVMGMINYKIAKSYGKDTGFAVGLTLVPFVFWMILGTSKDKYKGPAGPYKIEAPVAKGK
jgi:hypothetical protein